MQNLEVAAAGDKRQGYLPVAVVPEGEVESSTVTIYGNGLGESVLRVLALTPGFGSFSVPVGTWTVGDEGKNPFVDANPDPAYLTIHPEASTCQVGGVLSTDPSIMARCGKEQDVQGVVTDGLSALLMRVNAGLPGQACFEILSTEPLGRGAFSQTVTETTRIDGLYKAFAYYTPPDELGVLDDRRVVDVEFTYTPDLGFGVANTTRLGGKIPLVRPPVVLVHGLWSDKEAWSGDYQSSGFVETVVLSDYAQTHSAGFAANTGAVAKAVAKAVADSREKGYATTQADVVGHSMGGLLARLHIQSPTFRAPENLNRGDVRRLVTLTTPHFGSNLANLLVALYQALPEDTRRLVTKLVPASPAASLTGGAVCDLAENSPALAGIGSSLVPSHAITATGGPPGSPGQPAPFWGGVTFLDIGSFEAALTKVECVRENPIPDPEVRCLEERPVFPQALVDAFRFREPNDAIVPLSSQRGGVVGALSNYPDRIHFGPSLVDGVTDHAAAAQRVQLVLRARTRSGILVPALSAVLSDGQGGPRTVPGTGSAQDRATYAAQCGPGGSLNPGDGPAAQVLAQVEPVGDPRVTILEPSPGAVFAPGETIEVELLSNLVYGAEVKRRPGRVGEPLLH